MCLYPRLIKNGKYKANKKNGGVIPAIYNLRALATPVGCGNCIECCKKKGREWQIRLFEDIKENKNGIFVTLTFNTESLRKLYRRKEVKRLKGYKKDNAVAKIAVKLFRERWRKKYKKSIRHWLITELGHENTEHLHLHGIIWTNETIETITKIWGYGWMWPRDEKKRKKNWVNGQTVNYIIKYVAKRDFKHKYYKPIILTTPGIGNGYIKTHAAELNKYSEEKKTHDWYVSPTGHKIGMPVYYRNKIYDDFEREQLWMDKLDEGIRYVLGQKIDIKETEEEYYRIRREARIINKEIGYGTINIKKGNIGNTDEDYENRRRELKQMQRVKA